MIATPAWPPQSTPRLFVDAPLAPGPRRLDGPAAHYLIAVMRLRAGDPVKLFDDVSGEWLAVATDIARRDLTLDVQTLLRPREPVPDLWLCAAPLKKGRIDWLAEKACELGVDRLVPVITRRAVGMTCRHRWIASKRLSVSGSRESLTNRATWSPASMISCAVASASSALRATRRS